MAHVELSVTHPGEDTQPDPGSFFAPATSFDRWVAAVHDASEACLVIDAETAIHATSAPFRALFGLGDPVSTVGQHLLDAVLRLVDFTAARSDLIQAEIDKIPPLLALSSGQLARGLMRIQSGQTRDLIRTVDAIATPLFDSGGTPVGSLTFFSEV